MTHPPEADDLDAWLLAHADRYAPGDARQQTKLMLAGEGASDSALSRGLPLLAALSSLQELWITRADLGGRALEPLRACSSLRSLWLRECTLDEGSFASLRGVDTLVDLHVWAPAGDAALARLAELASLEVLELDGGSLTDAGLAELARLTTLRALDVRGARRVTDRGAAALGAAKHLTRLTLTGARGVHGECFSSLPASLAELDLASCAILDEHLAGLARLERLRGLSLSGTKVTDAGIASLSALFPALETLELDRTRVTAAGLAELPPAALRAVSMPYDGGKLARAKKIAAKRADTVARDFFVLTMAGTVGHAHFDSLYVESDLEKLEAALRDQIEKPIDRSMIEPGLAIRLLEFRRGKLRRRTDVTAAMQVHPTLEGGELGAGIALSELWGDADRRQRIRNDMDRGAVTWVVRIRTRDLKLPKTLAQPLAPGERARVPFDVLYPEAERDERAADALVLGLGWRERE